jgi:hypothetical protein
MTDQDKPKKIMSLRERIKRDREIAKPYREEIEMNRNIGLKIDNIKVDIAMREAIKRQEQIDKKEGIEYA